VERALADRIAGTWQHYVEQARAHRAGTFPLVGSRAAGTGQ
jgi:hypothetical protein